MPVGENLVSLIMTQQSRVSRCTPPLGPNGIAMVLVHQVYIPIDRSLLAREKCWSDAASLTCLQVRRKIRSGLLCPLWCYDVLCVYVYIEVDGHDLGEPKLFGMRECCFQVFTLNMVRDLM